MVALDAVSLRFGDVLALDEVSLEVGAGEIVSLLGPSGSGKSSLLRIVAGIERPTAGRVVLDGVEVAGSRRFIEPEHRRVGMVFQDYALFPHLTIAGNVAFGLKGRERADVSHTVGVLLERLGLARYSASYPHALSGGERQRVALARALAPGPELVLLDEPFSSLDATLRGELRREVELILDEAGTAALLVTHDQEEAMVMSDRIGVMRAGRLVQVGRPEEVYLKPSERWTAEFVGEVNVLAGLARGDEVDTEVGVFDLLGPVSGPVHVAIRPEQLELSAENRSNAEVVDREFRGHDVLYRLRHESGGWLMVQLPSLQLFDVGQQVFVRPVGEAVAPVVD
jgi:iron(III) transport system ATP-binding protein